MPYDDSGRFVHYGIDHSHSGIETNKAGIIAISLIFLGAIGYNMYFIAKNRTDHLTLQNHTRDNFQQTITYHNEHTHRQTTPQPWRKPPLPSPFD